MSGTARRKPVEGLTYEEAFKELEEIVTQLEKELRPLEEALTLFERGQALAKRCAGLLQEAELKVRRLSGENLEDLDEE